MVDARTPHSSSFLTKGFKEVLRMRLEQKPQNYCEEAAPTQIKQTQIGKGTCSSLTFSELLTLKGKACLEMERSNEESDEKTSGATPLSTPMLSCSRGNCQLPNLNLSLLPSPQSSESGQADQSQKQNPFPRFRPPRGRVSSPANDNGFRSPAQCKQQQQCSQLTIFYGETVNVYNDVTADMAKDLMVLASSSGLTKSASEASKPLTSTSSPPREICRPPLTTGASHIQPSSTLKSVNLPLSRKKSLQRFLERRRNDRLNERAPYPRLHQN